MGVDAEARSGAADDLVIALDQLEVPVALAGQRLGRALAGRQRPSRRSFIAMNGWFFMRRLLPLNRSRKTG